MKEVGDRVERGDPIAEVETDKTNVEMEALRLRDARRDHAGRGLRGVPVGETVGFLETDD